MREKEQHTLNRVSMVGRVDKEFNFSHECFGEDFYKATILVDRLNDTRDRIPLMVSDRLLDMDSCYAGRKIALEGELRSYNQHASVKAAGSPPMSVFVHNIRLLNGKEEKKAKEEDLISIEGFLCKPPVYRVTPLGRELTQLMVSVTRNYGKNDYIPCICWGRDARFAAHFSMGDRVSIQGRIQSRDYVRRTPENGTEKKTTYEVSVKRVAHFADKDKN